MNEITIFENPEFGSVRTIEDNSKVLFCGSDVAKALGYKDTVNALKTHCKEDGVVFHHIIDSLGRTQAAKFISEGNVYRLIAHSKLPAAEKFEAWIFDEVLPTIRKTGGYVSNDEMFIEIYLPYADDNTKQLFRLQLDTIRQLNKKIETDKPLVDFAEQIQTSEDSIDMKAMAKIVSKNNINIGRNNLFKFLRDKKVVNASNEPYAEYMNRSWFEVKESTYTNPYDEIKLRKTTLVKPKGQIGIVNLLRKYYI